jgi:putative (di)nucleoside polyphosphate hydrolase
METCPGSRYEEDVNLKAQFFRANVGAVLCGSDGHVLAFERSDRSGAWQLPQGGLEVGEEPAEAVLREVREETGLEALHLEPLREYPGLLAYELPEEARSEKTGRGQVQYWHYLACNTDPTLPRDSEFRAWRWVSLAALAAEVVPFRRPLYAQLAEYFERVVRPEL